MVTTGSGWYELLVSLTWLHTPKPHTHEHLDTPTLIDEKMLNMGMDALRLSTMSPRTLRDSLDSHFQSGYVQKYRVNTCKYA